MFLPVNFISTWVIETKGLKWALLLGVGIQTVGLWTRQFCTHGFYFVFAGQTFIAIGQPFMYNMPAKLSAIWFPPHERVMSTMVGVNMSILGTVPGFFLPSLFVTADTLKGDQTFSDEKSRHDLLMT